MNGTQSTIKRLDNELKALKMTAPISLGALKFPDQTPTASYTGSFDTASQDYVAARLVATFERTDGTATPLVDFTYEISVSPTYVEYQASQGITVTGNDPNVMTEFYTRGYVASASGKTVTFNIDVLNAFAPYAAAPATITVSVQAISTVKGTLTIERTI